MSTRFLGTDCCLATEVWWGRRRPFPVGHFPFLTLHCNLQDPAKQEIRPPLPPPLRHPQLFSSIKTVIILTASSFQFDTAGLSQHWFNISIIHLSRVAKHLKEHCSLLRWPPPSNDRTITGLSEQCCQYQPQIKTTQSINPLTAAVCFTVRLPDKQCIMFARHTCSTDC